NLLPEEKIEDEQEDGDRQEADERRKENIVLRSLLGNDARSKQGVLKVLVEFEVHLGPKWLRSPVRAGARQAANCVGRTVRFGNQLDWRGLGKKALVYLFIEVW